MYTYMFHILSCTSVNKCITKIFVLYKKFKTFINFKHLVKGFTCIGFTQLLNSNFYWLVKD